LSRVNVKAHPKIKVSDGRKTAATVLC